MTAVAERLEVLSDDDNRSQHTSTQRSNRRIVADGRGGPEILKVVEEPIPEPGPDELRIKILTTGVSFADLLMREGVHPETPHGRITLGWDLVGVTDAIGANVPGWAEGQTVAALPVMGGYADYICLRPDQLVLVPDGLDPAEAVSMVLNYMTAYQMLYRSAHVQSGQQILVHGAGGGIGTALLELGRLVNLTIYGTASYRSFETVESLGAHTIDYKNEDFVAEINRLTGDGVDYVFDGIGGAHVWRSFKALKPGGAVVAYGLTSSLRKGRLSGGPRHRYHGLARIGLYKLASALLPGRRKIRVYSIQRRMWRHPEWFRDDLTTLFGLLRDGKVKPLIAARMRLAEASKAHELLAKGGVTGKIVLTCGDEGA